MCPAYAISCSSSEHEQRAMSKRRRSRDQRCWWRVRKSREMGNDEGVDGEVPRQTTVMYVKTKVGIATRGETGDADVR